MTHMQTSDQPSIPAIKRLLIATDFSTASQAAFRTAIETCRELLASLVILHVFDAGIAPPESGRQMLEQQTLADGCRTSLEDLRRQAIDACVPCEAILEDGIAEAAILDTIAAKRIDLAVLGTSALHGFERLVFGSTAESVLRKATCPVLTVGPRVVHPVGAFATPQGPVVFATDFHGITIGAIRYAAQIAQLTGSPLHCLHVLPRTIEATRGEDRIVPGIMSEALKQVAGECGVVFDTPVCATAYGSEVSYAVVDYARQQKARLIVLGVRQASLLASRLPEHIAYRIITEAPCPVLTMAFGSQAKCAECNRRAAEASSCSRTGDVTANTDPHLRQCQNRTQGHPCDPSIPPRLQPNSARQTTAPAMASVPATAPSQSARH
jgi:nucleotide-binding universal stress UspA family protein